MTRFPNSPNITVGQGLALAELAANLCKVVADNRRRPRHKARADMLTALRESSDGDDLSLFCAERVVDIVLDVFYPTLPASRN